MKELLPPPPIEPSGPKAEPHKCKQCGEMVWYLKDARHGYIQPIDVEISEDGDIHVNPNIGRFVFVILEDRETLRAALKEGGLGLHHNHYDTCEWRKVHKVNVPRDGKEKGGRSREQKRKLKEDRDRAKEIADELGLDLG